MTLLELTTSVMGNLGDRASGKIGSASTESVVLSGINFALPQCVKLADPHYYDRSVIVDIPVGSPTEIAIPKITFDDVEHKIKDIVYIRTSRGADGTPYTITKVSWAQFLEVSRDYDQQLSGNPSFLSYHRESIFINRVPEEAYNLTLYAEVWPKTLSSNDNNLVLPIDVEWGLAVEAFATYYCYLKLQQTSLSEYWKQLYEDQKELNSQVKRKRDNRGTPSSSSGMLTGQPWLNPFVNTFN